MASNEHKNLSDINRHNPKGFEPATNDTILSKGIGTGATETDGSLVWRSISSVGSNNYKMQGYTTGTTNYKHGEDIADTKSPYEMAVDYGNSDVSSGSLTPSKVFRIGQGIVIPETASVTAIYGWATSSSNNVVTIAVCKVTPSTTEPPVSTALVPIVLAEVSVTGLSNNSKLIKIDDIDALSTTSLLAGDIIFPMIKEGGGAGNDIYMNINIQTAS